VKPVWLDIDQCGDSEYSIPAGFSDTHRDWTVNVPGKIVAALGHVHGHGVAQGPRRGLHPAPKRRLGCAAGAPALLVARRPTLAATLPDPRSRLEVQRRLRTRSSAAKGIKIIRTPIQAPQANAFAERFVGTVRRECLDCMLITGRRQLERVLHTYVDRYNSHRPHRDLGLLPPQPRPALRLAAPPDRLRIHRRDRLGGLIHEYTAAA
jgi:hypothetical protein